MKYNYKLTEKVNLTLENIQFFLKAFEINDLSKYNSSELIIESKKFIFFREDIKLLFSHMLSLHHLGAIYFHIDYLGNDFPVKEYQIKGNIQEYLYKNIDNYINDIRIGTEIPFGLAMQTENFILVCLQILYQEKNISLLKNYKILNDIIKSIKSKGGENIIQNELDLFYNYELYKSDLYSIFPILVELNKKGYLNIREIKYDKGEIGFNLRIISDLDNINKEEIIELFGSEDLYTKKIKSNDLIFDGIKIINGIKNKVLSGYKLKLAEYIFILNKDEKNYDWGLLMEHIYGKNGVGDGMVNLVKKLNRDFKYIGSELRLGYSEGSHIYIKH